jgi:hypothetical protein
MRDRGRRHQGALLAVQELREQLASRVGCEGLALRLRESLEERDLVEEEAILADDRLRGIDLDRPVELRLTVPLTLFRLRRGRSF